MESSAMLSIKVQYSCFTMSHFAIHSKFTNSVFYGIFVFYKYLFWRACTVHEDFKYSILLISGILLQLSCILGSCIATLTKFTPFEDIYCKSLLIPNLLSYFFILIGALGLFNLFKKIKDNISAQSKR